MKSKKVLAWHFTNTKLRGGGPIPKDGVTLKHKGNLHLCHAGFHASLKITDALKYAPGSILCRVELSGEIISSDDKLVAEERTILWRVEITAVLRKFARMCALDVIGQWKAPNVVKKFLKTGDESLRSAAWSAAWSAAESAAWSAAWSAAESAAWSAARSAAWSAARSAAGSAARSAAESAQEQRLIRLVNKAKQGK